MQVATQSVINHIVEKADRINNLVKRMLLNSHISVESDGLLLECILLLLSVSVAVWMDSEGFHYYWRCFLGQVVSARGVIYSILK